MKRREKKSYRKFNLNRFMQRRGINTRILGKLIGRSRATIRVWAKQVRIPTEYLPKLRALTKKDTEPERKWAEYDLTELRENLGASKTDMADLLNVHWPNINYWEKRIQIPRTLIPRIRELERESRE